MMTSQDYWVLATALSKMPLDSSWQQVCHHLATALRHDNPRFNTNQFLAACGIEVEAKDA